MHQNLFRAIVSISLFILILISCQHLAVNNLETSKSPNISSAFSFHFKLLTSPSPSVTPCDEPDMLDSVWLFETKFNWSTPRALCAAESLAIQMPNWCVRLFILNLQNQHKEVFAAEKVLRENNNIRISRLYPEVFLAGTPLQNFSGGDARKSYHYIVNLSDSLRTAVLFKHGGLYVDLDMVATKPLDITPNFFARQVPGGMVGNAIIKSSKASAPVFWHSMQKVREEFNPDVYATQMNTFCGAAREYCRSLGVEINGADETDPLEEKCGDWVVLGASARAMCHDYPMYESDPREVQTQMDKLIKENCSLLHWYSTYKWGSHRPINLDTEKDVFFARVAQRFCPTVAKSVTMF